MIKLYGGQFSRASIVHWYLEELGLEYDFIKLDMQAGEHRQAPFTTVNPFGKVPGIEDGDVKLWESGAILMYLAQTYGELKGASAAEVAIANQWIYFANATVGPSVFVEASREKEFPRLMGTLNEILGQQDYIAGSNFTVADVGLGSMLNYIPMMLKIGFEDYPNIGAYVQRISQREAFAKAMSNR